MGKLLPLHLTPLERWFVLDDSPSYPRCCTIDMELLGIFDRPAFESALQQALERHPLLQALIGPAKRHDLCWIAAGGLMPEVDWDDSAKPIQCPRGEQIDLHCEVGLRLWIRQGAERARLTIQFHHACTDGTGAYRFVGELLALYGQRTASRSNERPSLGPIDLEKLRTRNHRMLGEVTSIGPYTLVGRAIRAAADHLCSRIAPLNRPQPTAAQRLRPFPGIATSIFSEQEHRLLRDAALKLGATVNDLLMAVLFCTACQWNALHPRALQRTRYRLAIPADLRLADDFDVPAANFSAIIFPTRSAREMANPLQLVRSVCQEMAHIGHQRRTMRFVEAVTAGAHYSWALKAVGRWSSCLATAILSNSGDPSRRFTSRFTRHLGRLVCGDLLLDEITGVPPLGGNTRATFSVVSYRRRLTLSVICDPYCFRMADAYQLLDLFTGNLRAYLPTPGASAVAPPDEVLARRQLDELSSQQL